jgi:hypothetical protein
MKKKLPPLGVMHEPKPMLWAEATPLSEHKNREKSGITAVVPAGCKKNPEPISRATTELRRAYPYIFDCAAYAKTQNPQNIEYDNVYARFELPYEIFLEYCLDDCNEQREYLLSEISKLMEGQPAKYIKVSPEKTVYAQPVILSFTRTDLKTGKEKRLENIGQDTRVSMVQVQILKELLDDTHGYVNLPKAFYAKTKRLYNSMRENVKPVREAKNDYRKLVNTIKSLASEPISTREAAQMGQSIIEQDNMLESLNPEQGGFHKIYLAFEYLLANRARGKNGKKQQEYKFINLCEKCAPDMINTEENGKKYFKDRLNALRYGLMICAFINIMPENDRQIIGIKEIKMDALRALIAEFMTDGKKLHANFP